MARKSKKPRGGSSAKKQSQSPQETVERRRHQSYERRQKSPMTKRQVERITSAITRRINQLDTRLTRETQQRRGLANFQLKTHSSELKELKTQLEQLKGGNVSAEQLEDFVKKADKRMDKISQEQKHIEGRAKERERELKKKFGQSLGKTIAQQKELKSQLKKAIMAGDSIAIKLVKEDIADLKSSMDKIGANSLKGEQALGEIEKLKSEADRALKDLNNRTRNQRKDQVNFNRTINDRLKAAEGDVSLINNVVARQIKTLDNLRPKLRNELMSELMEKLEERMQKQANSGAPLDPQSSMLKIITESHHLTSAQKTQLMQNIVAASGSGGSVEERLKKLEEKKKDEKEKEKKSGSELPWWERTRRGADGIAAASNSIFSIPTSAMLQALQVIVLALAIYFVFQIFGAF